MVIRKPLGQVSTHIAVSPKFEFEFDCLFQPFESPGREISAYHASHGQSEFQIQRQREYVPVAFVFFQGRYTQKLIDGLLRIIPLHLLSVVVFILDPDISRLIVIRIFILEVIPVIQSRSVIGCLCLTLGGRWRGKNILFVTRLLHEIIVVGHGGRSENKTRQGKSRGFLK